MNRTRIMLMKKLVLFLCLVVGGAAAVHMSRPHSREPSPAQKKSSTAKPELRLATDDLVLKGIESDKSG